MKPSRPSITAAVVAWARAAASPGDALTPELLPRPYRHTLAAPSTGRLGDVLSNGVRRIVSAGLLDHMKLRTAAIDALVVKAVRGGARQVVLLGAGLDARAHRMAELAGITVFEVDHPASQAYKRKKVQRAGVDDAEVRYVAVDFERESLSERLVEAGFSGDSPSFWVWEGVTMYLEHAATEATMRAIAEVGCPGSGVAMSYMLPTPLGGASRWVHRALAVIDEPLRGGLSPEQVRHMLHSAGFAVLADGSNWDWARELGADGAGWALLWRAERLAVAELAVRGRR